MHPDPSRKPDVEYRFRNDPLAPRGARQAVRHLLDDPDDPIVEPVTMVASELVSNVVQHTTGEGILRVWDPKPDVPLRLEVEDHEPAEVAAAAMPPTSTSGRGLNIVQQVADAWGSFATSVGKVVWAEFDRVRRSRGASS